MLQDLRYSVRSLAKHLPFVFAAVLVLGLAVGVNTAVFSLVNSLLLRPLPVRAPRELGFVYDSDRRMGLSYRSYLQLVQKTDAFSGIAAWSGDKGRLRRGHDITVLHGEAVSANYLDVLGVGPRLGRSFQTADDAASAAPVAIISDTLWKSQYASDPLILGRTLSIDSAGLYLGRYGAWKDYTIVGVMPATFTGTGSPWQPAQYWVPLRQRAYDNPERARAFNYDPLAMRGVVPIGRMKPGVTFAQARGAVEAAGRDIILQSPDGSRRQNGSYQLAPSPRLRLPFNGAYFLSVPRLVAGLMAVATLLMLIAATNLTGMLMSRGVGRRTEMAVRLSLGAGRGRLVRQLLTESALLAGGGTLAGLALSRLLVIAAVREIPLHLPGANSALLDVQVPLDGAVLLFACGSCFVTALLVGLAPALAAVRTDLLSSLSSSGIVAPRQERARVRRLVLVPQIALSLTLLLVAGVMVRSLLRIELAPPGYNAEHVVLLQIELPFVAVDTREKRVEESHAARVIEDRIVARLGALSEVSAAGLTETSFQGVPLAQSTASVIARSDFGTTNIHHGATSGAVSADYFTVMGIPLIRGRAFDERDRKDEATTAIVSERLAHELWPGQDPIGEALAFHSPDSVLPPRWLEVVGIARPVTLPLEEYPRPVFYVPVESQPLNASTLVVRASGNPSQLIARLKDAIAQAAPSVLVSDARPLDDTVSALRYPQRFSAALLGASGVAGLILVTIGVFGLVSYAVRQRLGEIGVRLVLGAQRRDIIRLVLFDGAGVVIAGLAVGFALAFAAIRYASHAIVPLPDMDPLTFVLVPALLAAVVLLACYLPARRAAKLDPLVVLRIS